MFVLKTPLVNYQNLTSDELLHLATEEAQLTNEARLALEAELSRRRISQSDVHSYVVEVEAADKAEKLRIASQFTRKGFLEGRGWGRYFLGKTKRRRDPSGSFELYESTLWFLVFWLPIYPIASFTVRRNLRQWLGMEFGADQIALERHKRNWEQILLTWVKASAVLLLLRLAYFVLIRYRLLR
jgi:hypothetical protein